MEHSPITHPAPRTYVGVFVWLTALTAIEVGVSYLPMPHVPKIAILATIAVIKAALVVLFYMHLRYDSRWYALILLVGIFFAVLVGRFLLIT